MPAASPAHDDEHRPTQDHVPAVGGAKASEAPGKTEPARVEGGHELPSAVGSPIDRLDTAATSAVGTAYGASMAASETFRAMNTDIDVLVEGVDTVPRFAQNTFEEEEARFSRFRPESLLSRLNAGEAVADERFAEVCALALRAHALTANGLICDAGVEPAERTRMAPPPSARAKPAAICERPALCTHTNKTSGLGCGAPVIRRSYPGAPPAPIPGAPAPGQRHHRPERPRPPPRARVGPRGNPSISRNDRRDFSPDRRSAMRLLTTPSAYRVAEAARR